MNKKDFYHFAKFVILIEILIFEVGQISAMGREALFVRIFLQFINYNGFVRYLHLHVRIYLL